MSKNNTGTLFAIYVLVDNNVNYDNITTLITLITIIIIIIGETT
tara:strand:- start:207 stop:338 length:132 start_codon:yes stop_codon:yes gene_type:complete